MCRRCFLPFLQMPETYISLQNEMNRVLVQHYQWRLQLHFVMIGLLHHTTVKAEVCGWANTKERSSRRLGIHWESTVHIWRFRDWGYQVGGMPSNLRIQEKKWPKSQSSWKQHLHLRGSKMPTAVSIVALSLLSEKCNTDTDSSCTREMCS